MQKSFPARRTALARATTSLGLALCMQAALAQNVQFDIPAQPLPSALAAFARQSGLQLAFTPELVEGKQARRLEGSRDARAALDELLRGTGLQGRVEGKTMTIQAAPSGTSESTLPSVTVTADAERSPTTEQTGSYTARALSIGKIEQSIRETPQSVSVVTRQQMDDQNLTTLDQVIAQATGTTKTQRNFGDHKFVIRGFVLDNDNYLVDGVPGMLYSSTGWVPMDMAIYDRVEVLRGAGGLIVGAADPSGAINLVRKRPRTEKHFDFTASIGSWNNDRTEIDAGGALNAEGTVRGRVVAAYQDRHYFYDLAKSKQPLLYGVIEADLTRSTRLTVGARHQENEIAGYSVFGLPRYRDGGSLDLPRSTSLAQDWNRHDATVDEVFAELEHRFDADWKGKLTLNRSETSLAQRMAIARGAAARDTLVGSSWSSLYFHDTHVTSTGLDANLTGGFQAWGGKHQLMVGANWSEQKVHRQTAGLDGDAAVDLRHPDHSLVPEPVQPPWSYDDITKDRRMGLYASARLQLAEPLHLLVGARLSWLDYRGTDQFTGARSARYQQDSQFTPYAGLTYDLGKQWTVYASYADIFQPQSSYLTASGAPLDPAIGSNYEAGLKGELYDGRLNVSAAVFQVRKTGNAVIDDRNLGNCPASFSSSDCFRNGGRIRSRGFELEASGELARGWQVSAGYTHLKIGTDDEQNLSISDESPRQLFRASTSYQLPGALNAWTLGASVSAQSSYGYAFGSASIREPGRAVWDLSAAYRINRNWTAALRIANLGDRKYYAMNGNNDRGNYYGEPRSAMLTVRGEF